MYLLRQPGQTYTVGGRKFLLEQRLGQGAFGEVFKVREENSGDVYALKVMKMKDGRKPDLEREVNALKNAVSHENIVTLYDSERNDGQALILMEFCAGGNLNTRLDQSGITENLKLRWMRELSSAMSFLHSKGIVHRDLKPENVLLTSSDSIKLADFGLAREFAALTQQGNGSDQHLVNYMTMYMTSQYGTPVWMAPEVLKSHYTEKADIFTLGAIFFTIQTGSFIIYEGKKYFVAFVTVRGKNVGLGQAMYYDQSVKLHLDNISPQSIRDLIEKMTKYDPKERPNARDVLAKLK